MSEPVMLDYEIPSETTSTVLTATTVGRLRRPQSLDSESARWASLTSALRRKIEEGALSPTQVARLWTIWNDATAKAPHLRYPAVGVSTDGRLEVSWAYADVPNAVVTIEIAPDGTFEWFARDKAASEVLEGDATEAPATLLERLARFFLRKRDASGRR